MSENNRITEDFDAVMNAPQAPAASTEQQAQARVNACAAEIQQALQRHRCVILPQIDPPKAVGGQPVREMMISASYAIYATQEQASQ